MIKMYMHRCHRQVVMRMLLGRQSFGQGALVMIEDVRQAGDALATVACHLFQIFESIANEIAYRLATIFIAAFLDVTIKGVG
jgi:short subunit fatty acids transporter